MLPSSPANPLRSFEHSHEPHKKAFLNLCYVHIILTTLNNKIGHLQEKRFLARMRQPDKFFHFGQKARFVLFFHALRKYPGNLASEASSKEKQERKNKKEKNRQ